MKTGKWEQVDDKDIFRWDYFKCTACGDFQPYSKRFAFCPLCGAHMLTDEEEMEKVFSRNAEADKEKF